MDTLAESIPNALLEEWTLYLSIEPQGAAADDYRASGIMALLANQNRKRAIPQSKFALMRDEQATDLYARFKSFALALGATKKNPGS